MPITHLKAILHHKVKAHPNTSEHTLSLFLSASLFHDQKFMVHIRKQYCVFLGMFSDFGLTKIALTFQITGWNFYPLQ